MFGIGSHVAPRFGFLALLVLGSAYAWGTQEQAPAPRRMVCATLMMDSSPRFSDPRTRAEAAYRAGDFAEAADIIAAIRPSDVDLQNLALQYDRLGRTWTIAFDPTSPPIETFEALREAMKLDIVLGGVHAQTLAAKMRTVATRAAVAYLARQDYHEAEVALLTARSLGADDAATAAVGESLAAAIGPE